MVGAELSSVRALFLLAWYCLHVHFDLVSHVFDVVPTFEPFVHTVDISSIQSLLLHFSDNLIVNGMVLG